MYRIFLGPNPFDSLLPKDTYSNKDEIESFKLKDSFKDKGVNFVAIDLETATSDRDSICEIGLCVVKKEQIVETKSWLVQPPDNDYDDFNINIHGITPEDTAMSPSFPDIWKEVLPYLSGQIVVAHNTSFDMYALRDSFVLEGVPFPDFLHFCSCRISKKSFPNLYCYSLDEVCKELGIKLEKHHRAGCDAEACARIFLACLEASAVDSYYELQNKYNFKCGRFADNYFRPQLAYSNSYSKLKLSDIKGDPNKIDEGSYFFEKEVCFTGKCMYAIRKDLLQMVADIGGIPTNSVTSSTNILVVGQQDYRVVGESGMSSKQKKAMSLKDKGQDIEILSEADFLRMIGI